MGLLHAELYDFRVLVEESYRLGGEDIEEDADGLGEKDTEHNAE